MDRFYSPKMLFVFIVVVFSLKCSEGKEGFVVWNSCGGNGFTMKNITLSPNPFQIPGDVTLSATIKIKTTLKNLSSKVTLEKKNDMNIYEDFSYDCNFGGILIDSCEHDDLCTEWAKGDCPMNIKAINKHCTCPLKKGTYQLIQDKWNIPDELKPGQYRLREEMIMNKEVIGCIESEWTITSRKN